MHTQVGAAPRWPALAVGAVGSSPSPAVGAASSRKVLNKTVGFCSPAPHCTGTVLMYCHCTACTADVEYEENLKYFLEFGVQPGDGCDYLLVVQTVGGCTRDARGCPVCV